MVTTTHLTNKHYSWSPPPLVSTDSPIMSSPSHVHSHPNNCIILLLRPPHAPISLFCIPLSSLIHAYLPFNSILIVCPYLLILLPTQSCKSLTHSYLSGVEGNLGIIITIIYLLIIFSFSFLFSPTRCGSLGRSLNKNLL